MNRASAWPSPSVLGFNHPRYSQTDDTGNIFSLSLRWSPVSFTALFFITTLHVVSFDLSCITDRWVSKVPMREGEMAHRIYEWVVVVKNTINGCVHCIMNVLEWDFPLWCVLQLFRLWNPLDHQQNKLHIKFLLVGCLNISYLSCFHNLLLQELIAVSNQNRGLWGVYEWSVHLEHW